MTGVHIRRKKNGGKIVIVKEVGGEEEPLADGIYENFYYQLLPECSKFPFVLSVETDKNGNQKVFIDRQEFPDSQLENITFHPKED